MANAQVEKLKDLGLRHGEKIVVGLAAAVCMVLLVLAVQKPTIALTPDEVKEAANAAKQNIDRQQDTKEILEKIEADGLKDPGFVKIVQQREGREASVESVALTHPFTYPDPGAGLIREAVELIAPTDLLAQAGRGGIHVFALDENGNRIPEDPETKKGAAKGARRPPRGASMAMSSSYGGMMGGAAARPGNPQREAEAKKAAEREELRRRRAVAGLNANAPAEAEEPTTTEVPYQEVTRGFRWVAMTGILDYKLLRENYARALKVDLSSAYPNFVRLDVERQQRTLDADWSDWAPVDRAANQRIFDNLTEQDDDEWTPPEVRLAPLVDLLPYLRAGYWAGVHHVKLVPKERLAKPKTPDLMAGGAMGEYSSSSSQQQMMMMSGSGGGMPGGASEMGYGSSSSSMGMMSSMGGMAGAAENTDFPKSEAPQVMVRALDFSVEPDTFYRYRVRIVVRNPNQNRGDVSPGVDNTSEELTGPWSEETAEVQVPPDVTVYALKKAPALGQIPREDVVDFQVARWNPEDGVSVIHAFPAAPGQLIGDPYTLQVPPVDETEKVERKLIDFNSRQLVLDTSGGTRPIPVPGVSGAGFDIPALATVLRPDGTVVVRNQARDARNPEMLELQESYARAIRDGGQKRRPVMPGYGSSSGMMGMPGAAGP